jgi:tetratricopeptide (TPR) repeat protein
LVWPQNAAGGAPAGQDSEPSKTRSPQSKSANAQSEEIKKHNEKASNMNLLIQRANAAIYAKNWEDAVEPLQQLIAMDPGRWQFYSALGDVQYKLGQYERAVDSYQKGIHMAESTTTVDIKDAATDPAQKRAGVANMLTSEGNAWLKLDKNKSREAVELYTRAATVDPNTTVAYFNICVTQYNSGNAQLALEACDKSIAADPDKAEAYFVKGWLLNAGRDADSGGSVIAPAGMAEALNKYLELAPTGLYVSDAKQMLKSLGAKVESSDNSKRR